MKVRPMRGKVLVKNMSQGERQVGRFIIPDDNRKLMGIRDRWAQVYAVGEDIDEVQENDWILMIHGRWTRGVTLTEDDGSELIIWSVDWPDGVLVVADTPGESSLSDIPDVPTLDR